MATLAMPLTSAPASSAIRSSVNCSGSRRTHSCTRSATSLSRRYAPTSGSVSSSSIVSGSCSENLRASATACGPSTPTSKAGEPPTARATIATANPRRRCHRRWIESTTGSRARAISTPMPIRVSIVVVLRNRAISARAASTARTR